MTDYVQFRKWACGYAEDTMHRISMSHDDEQAIKLALQTAVELVVAVMLTIEENSGEDEMYKALDCLVADIDERVQLK